MALMAAVLVSDLVGSAYNVIADALVVSACKNVSAT